MYNNVRIRNKTDENNISSYKACGRVVIKVNFDSGTITTIINRKINKVKIKIPGLCKTTNLHQYGLKIFFLSLKRTLTLIIYNG